MRIFRRNNRQSVWGFSFIDLIMSIGIIVLLFGGIYLVFFSLLDVINNTELRTLATSVLNRQVEVVRNLPYAEVGTVGGVPAGIIPQTQGIAWGGVSFSVTTVIRSIDDPFDGTIGGTPDDTSPADYKLVEFEIACTSCARFVPLRMTTTVAPKALESASDNGALFVHVFDANGLPIAGADAHVVNTHISSSIDLFDSTNTSGTLQLVDIATSTNHYEISVSMPGYSSEKTYPLGDAENPNPVKPHATVSERQVTQMSFAIDRVSTLNIRTQDVVCAPLGGKNFSISGAKLIGTGPDVYKFATSSLTNGSGLAALANMEWDTYAILLGVPEDLAGSIPLTPFVLNPSSTLDIHFILQPADPNALLVTAKDDTDGSPIAGASVELTRSGFSRTLTAGRSALTHTDWSGNQYASQDGGIDADATPGSLQLVSAGGVYATGTTSWLVSNTFDIGGIPSALYTLSWNPASPPPETGSGSVKFQIASNSDDATWNFIGPDGTGSTFYTTSGDVVHASHADQRYVRYKVFMATADENYTPRVDDVALAFSGPCVPPAQTLFNDLGAGTYLVRATAAGYIEATSSVGVGSGWQQIEMRLEK